MSNKYRANGRSLSISRDEDSKEPAEKLPAWLDNFAKSIEKTEKEAVESRKQQDSTYDQISQILGTKSKYCNVEEAVADMRKRTGLSDFLQSRANAEIKKEDKTPALFTELKDTKTFIDNYIKSIPGIAIDAVVEALKRHFKGRLPAEKLDEDLSNYINKAILEEKQSRPNDASDSNNLNIGKLDTKENDISQENTDFFQGCMPAKV